MLGISSTDAGGWGAGDAGDDDEADEFEIYAENSLAVSVFMSMATQWDWTGGMESHRCGLKHEVLPLHMKKAGVPRKRRFDVMADVQVMERSALDVWHQAASDRQEQQRRQAGK